MKHYGVNLGDKRPIEKDELDLEPTTIAQELRKSVERNGDRTQYVTSDGKRYTASEFSTLCHRVAAAYIGLDVGKGSGVGILGFNSVEWFAADVGATLIGVIPSGIYTTNHGDIVAHILNEGKCRLAFVDGEKSLGKVLGIQDKCPELKAVVYWSEVVLDKFSDHKEFVYSWEEFLDFGKTINDGDVAKQGESVSPEECCKLIFTSGTTGPPKGVMITHYNVVWTVFSVLQLFKLETNDRLVSFLPVSHVAANMIDIMGPILCDFCVHFAAPDALKGSLVKTLMEVRPTVFLAVPRVWEKIRDKMMEAGAKRGPIARVLSNWAKGIGSAACKAEDEGSLMPFGFRVANFLIFNNVRRAIGLDCARVIVNAAAPLQAVTDDYFRSLHLKIVDLYGMSEATGPLTVNYPAYKHGTSGKCIPGVKVKLDGVVKGDDGGAGEGELCFRGGNVFLGYLNNEEETKKCIDEEGWLHSGDLGSIDEEDYVTITGRVKDLIVTAGGENVAPLHLEALLLDKLPAITRSFALGDKRKFVSCLLVPYVDEEGNLMGAAREVNKNVTTAAEAARDETWKQYIEKGIEKVNERAVSNAAKIRKFRLLERDFSVETGELTPTMKVKRKIVHEMYDGVIGGMYE